MIRCALQGSRLSRKLLEKSVYYGFRVLRSHILQQLIQNVSVDQFWWWWVIHLWVEATWEVLVGCIMAWGLMKTLGARRRVVTTWLYIEVALMFGSGILGLGHHEDQSRAQASRPRLLVSRCAPERRLQIGLLGC